MPGKSAKKPVRKVNENAGKRGYKTLYGESPSAQARAGQSRSDRRKTATRVKAAQKRDAIKRGAEGPKKSMGPKKLMKRGR